MTWEYNEKSDQINEAGEEVLCLALRPTSSLGEKHINGITIAKHETHTGRDLAGLSTSLVS